MGAAEKAVRHRLAVKKRREAFAVDLENKKRIRLAQEVQQEIPRALARLAEKGYPNASLDRVWVFPGFKKEVAFWSLDAGEVYLRGDYSTRRIKLYSNGKFESGISPYSLHSKDLSMLLNSLRCL